MSHGYTARSTQPLIRCHHRDRQQLQKDSACPGRRHAKLTRLAQDHTRPRQRRSPAIMASHSMSSLFSSIAPSQTFSQSPTAAPPLQLVKADIQAVKTRATATSHQPPLPTRHHQRKAFLTGMSRLLEAHGGRAYYERTQQTHRIIGKQMCILMASTPRSQSQASPQKHSRIPPPHMICRVLPEAASGGRRRKNTSNLRSGISSSIIVSNNAYPWMPKMSGSMGLPRREVANSHIRMLCSDTGVIRDPQVHPLPRQARMTTTMMMMKTIFLPSDPRRLNHRLL